MRASREKAPGPSSATATAKTFNSTADSSRPETAKAPAPNVTMIAITGVIRPTSKHAALIRLKPARIQPGALNLVAEMYVAVCASNVKLTKPRRRRRPMPDQPPGKAENSFCRTTLLQREISPSVSLRMLSAVRIQRYR